MGHGDYGQRPKRVGVWYLLLLVGGMAGALAVARYFELGVAATAGTLLPTVAPAYLAWKAFANNGGQPPADLATVADQLAGAVRGQWDAEAAIRRVNDPYPLPVVWEAADADLVEPWPLLTEVAQAWPGGPPGEPEKWPVGVAGLVGSYVEIGEVFTDRVPTRRMVVLGEPGAGKSVLLIRLLQDLIERRPAGGPVPVLFSLASWDPAHQRLELWLAEQLRRAHPGLRAPAPIQVVAPVAARSDEVDLAHALVGSRLILPLLDGFDELPPALQAMALDAINRALPPKQPLVLASRTAAYRAAVTGPDAVARLNGAAGIHLLPPAPEQASAYLRRDAGGPQSPASQRWNAVIAQLGTDSPVGQALATPLGLFLARTIYNPRPQTTAATAIPHPDQLCDAATFPHRAAVDTHLYNAFIPAAYTPHHPHPPRWSALQAHRILVYLAKHLETHRGGSPDLTWWELHLALSSNVRATLFGMGTGIAAGSAAGVGVGIGMGAEFGGTIAAALTFGLLFGLPLGVAAGLTTRPYSPTPSIRLRWSSRAVGRNLLLGFMIGLGAAFVVGLGPALVVDPVVGASVGLTAGVASMLATGLRAGLTAEKHDLATQVGPHMLIAQDRRSFLLIALALGLPPGLVFGIMFGLGLEPISGIGCGLAVGIGAAITFGRLQTAWADYVAVRIYLAVRRELPRDLMAFLKDSHDNRGVLRQVGTVYQFRHIDLQRHLARSAPR